MAIIIGEPVSVSTTEIFVHLKETDEWKYQTPSDISPTGMLDVVGLFEGLKVMDTIEVGLPIEAGNIKLDRLVVCAAVSPMTHDAVWVRKLVPIDSIIQFGYQAILPDSD